jgi:hypothetical protein
VYFLDGFLSPAVTIVKESIFEFRHCFFLSSYSFKFLLSTVLSFEFDPQIKLLDVFAGENQGLQRKGVWFQG